jgi:hypothetical protein
VIRRRRLRHVVSKISIHAKLTRSIGDAVSPTSRHYAD